jgi:hypothetical protein
MTATPLSDPLLWPLMAADHWYVDALRVFIIAGALWLMVIHVRLAIIRWKRPHPGEVFTHPAMHLSFVVLLIDIAIRRIEYIESSRPPDLFLIISGLAVGLGLYGTVRRIHQRPRR